MSRLLFVFVLSLACLASPASAQGPRVAVGVGTANLGDFATVFENQVAGFSQVAPGLAAQRSFPVWWLVEAEAFAPVGPVGVGGRLQGRWSQADALYGDYAGTVDVVARARALLAEVEVAVPLPSRLPLRIAGHGGAVLLSSKVASDAVATFEGRTERVAYRLNGSGTGATAGVSLLLDVPTSPAAISARLSARWAHVPSLDATEVTSFSRTTGRLRLDHNLSGITLSVGVGL